MRDEETAWAWVEQRRNDAPLLTLFRRKRQPQQQSFNDIKSFSREIVAGLKVDIELTCQNMELSSSADN